jgi:coenzyme F420 hydrogenase subunit beta
MKSKNIESIVKKNLCSGCGICIAICPTNSIDVEMDYLQGIYAPKIDASKCKSCELCLSICPGKGVDFPKLCEDIFDYKKEPCLLGNYLCCYEGYSNDKDIRLNSSSGGLVTQTLIYALEKKIIDGA